MSRRLHVMATEDDPGLRDLLAEILEGEGHRATFSLDQDVAAVAADPPDLLLLDGRGLPGDSGWAFLERLKADPRTAPIPVVILTGEGWATEGHAARLAALDTVLVLKPFDLAELVEQVRRRLRGEPA
jgi:two-component system phosphate regulon response regulator PhoB